MNKHFVRIIGIILVLCTVLSFASCSQILDGLSGAIGDQGGLGSGDSGSGGSGTGDSGSGGSGTGDGSGGGEVVFPGEGEDELPPEWSDPSLTQTDLTAIRVILDTDTDLNEYLEDYEPIGELVWSSRCEEIATVDGGVVSAKDVGRTRISVSDGDRVVHEFSLTVEFKIMDNSGFDIVTDVVDDTEYKVKSLREANDILDRAIAKRVQKLTIDFSGISADFTADDFDLDSELGNHTTLRMLFYEDKPYVIHFEIVYRKDAASVTTPEGSISGSKPTTVTSANALAYSALIFKNATSRADNFDGFAINDPEIPELLVYNSEELWWAVEHGYRPIFPESKTKAELFYERAKMILREIVHDGMSDYEKARVIYEYLIGAVKYDYDAFFGGVDRDNTCYFLEGVFESGRAVCDGKTKAYVLLCGIEGVKCVRDFGASVTGGAGHAWNYVLIDGVWYLVDTTEGDVRYKSDSGIGGFFGYEIETVGYSGFMRPIDYLADKYEYTDKWAEIVELEQEYKLEDYFQMDIAAGVDLVIESKKEAEAIFAAIKEAGAPDELILVFIPEVSDRTFDYFRNIKSEFDYEMAVFTTEYGDVTVYLALFKTAVNGGE